VFVTAIGEIGLLSVSDEEEITQHIDAASLLPFSEQRGDGHLQKLPQQIQQRRLNCSNCMDGGALIEGLQAATGSVSIGKLPPHSIQNAIPVANPLSDDQRFRIIENFASSLRPELLRLQFARSRLL
jgi:hypothetical protein